ncbi:MAG: hypothetical protein J6M60_00480 [Clostridia bacterium]|nr:hypothetical protein [Clostridia bacterium]
MNEKEILDKFKMQVAVSNFKNQSNNKHTLKEEINWRKYAMKKKLIAITCGVVLVISGGVFAYNKIIPSFRFGKGLDRAIENGYIATPEMDYISSETTLIDTKTNITLDNINVDAKIEDFIMDDITIGAHFGFEIDTKINETIDLDRIEQIDLDDLIVTDENKNILYCLDKETFEKYCSDNNLNYQYGEFNEHFYNCGVNSIMTYHSKNTGLVNLTLNMYSAGENFPKCKKLNFNFSKIKLTTNDIELVLNGNWNMNFNVPEEIYRRSSIAYKVVSCENPDFNVTNATLTNTGFEIGINISNMPRPIYPEDLKNLEDKALKGEISFDEYNKIVNDNKDIIEARQTFFYEDMMPIQTYDLENRKEPDFNKITYVENEKGEKFSTSRSAGRRQDANYKDGDIFHFYETFTLTKYDATDKLKVSVMFKHKPYIIELERVK